LSSSFLQVKEGGILEEKDRWFAKTAKPLS